LTYSEWNRTHTVKKKKWLKKTTDRTKGSERGGGGEKKKKRKQPPKKGVSTPFPIGPPAVVASTAGCLSRKKKNAESSYTFQKGGGWEIEEKKNV